jgi:hypothetical protein
MFSDGASTASGDVLVRGDSSVTLPNNIAVAYSFGTSEGKLIVRVSLGSGQDIAEIAVPVSTGPGTYALSGTGNFITFPVVPSDGGDASSVGAGTRTPVMGSLVVQAYSVTNCEYNPADNGMVGASSCDSDFEATLTMNASDGADISTSGDFTIRYRTTAYVTDCEWGPVGETVDSGSVVLG